MSMMKRIFLLAIGAVALIILGTIVSIGLNPAGFVNCFRDKSNDAVQIAQPAPKIAVSGQYLEEKARDFGHKIALAIERGHSFDSDTIYAMCLMEAKQEGYTNSDDPYRFVNIAKLKLFADLKNYR
jgi:hypothetical protein